MVDEAKGAVFPVVSSSLTAELQAAFARIAQVPAGRTLVDEIDSAHWAEGVDGCIEAGSIEHEDGDLDHFDQHIKKVA